MNLSACIITLNEQEQLPRCLNSCADLVDEIVVVDSGSTDSTEQIARQFGAHWHVQPWQGFVGQKNTVLSFAQHDWVLHLDADEELSPQLRDEIRELKAHPPADNVSGFTMPRCVLYQGRWIRHGDWYPDRVLRLFRKSHGNFGGHEPHAVFQASGEIRRFKGDLFHYSFRDDADHWARCEKYAKVWAEAQRKSGRAAGALSPWTHAAFRWVRGYILKRGFLDGRRGWQIAGFCAREVFLKYTLLRRAVSGR